MIETGITAVTVSNKNANGYIVADAILCVPVKNE